MNSKIIYREFTSEHDISSCITLQKKIFHLSNLNVIPGIILHMIARKDPFMGLMVGVFKEDETKTEMIGFCLSFSTNEPNTLYTAALGILPKYQNGIYGFKLMLKVREIALSQNIKSFYILYDPLESNLGRLYMVRMGFEGVRFKESAYLLNENNAEEVQIPYDKILVKWDPLSKKTLDKIKGNYILPKLGQIVEEYPVIKSDNMVDHNCVLVEVPEDFLSLVKNSPVIARKIRLEIRKIFKEYINERGYIISECISGKINRERRSFYLLEKR